ncbi:MAG: hypothetical protein JWR26_1424 [Pedosphaera sp.]|nr:hypothetical protein [Pedosphaera sp.]
MNVLAVSGGRPKGAWRSAWGWGAVCLAAMVWQALPATGSATGFTVSLDRDTITLGESATLSLNFEGGSPKALPPLPAIANLNIMNSPNHSKEFSLFSGEQSSKESYGYGVMPTQAGEYIIPAMSAEIGGKVYTSLALRLKVLAPSATPETPTAPKTAWLKLIVPKAEVYVGEILPIEIQLYAQAGQLKEMPHFKEEGFTLGKMGQPAQSATVINGQRINVLTFKTYVVAVKTGKLDIGPAAMAIDVPRPNSRRTIFGELLDWQALSLESEPQTLNVLPLPKEDVPPGFSGAVGSYTLTEAVSPTNVAVGDPITINVQIAGRGSVDSVTLPAQNGWQQFKLYPPTSEFQPGDAMGLSGTRTFKLTAVPESMDIKELPQFVFSYFDPEQKGYRILTQPAVALTVRPSAASLPPPVASNATGAADNVTIGPDILHIKPRLGVMGQIQAPLIQQPWFLALQGVPALAWLCLLIKRKQAEKLANNPRLRRERQTDQIVRAGLKELHQAANANEPQPFFATLFHLLQERLGERLDVPASAITEAVLEERLRPMRVPEETIKLLHELFLTCNQARYAPQSTNEGLLSLIPKVQKALEDLKRIKT